MTNSENHAALIKEREEKIQILLKMMVKEKRTPVNSRLKAVLQTTNSWTIGTSGTSWSVFRDWFPKIML